MMTSVQGGSATIHQFPARGRFASGANSHASPQQGEQAKAAAPRVERVVFGSGWYHDEAIEAERIFKKWELDAVVIGRVTDDSHLRIKKNGSIVADIPNTTLTDAAPLYRRPISKPIGDPAQGQVRGQQRKQAHLGRGEAHGLR